MNNVNDTLTERGKRYGTFTGHAEIAQHLKQTINRYLDKREQHLADDQKEALDMICHKIARIVNGDPNYAENWRDIAGYSTLVMDRLLESEGATDAVVKQVRMSGGKWVDC